MATSIRTSGLLRGDQRWSRARWLPALIMALVLAILGYRVLARWVAPRGAMVVAARALAPDTMLTAADVTMRPFRGKPMPGVLGAPDRATGRVLKTSKQAGDPILAGDLQVPRPPAPQLATMIPEGRVLTTLTIKNLTLPLADLRRGDRVDVLVAGRTDNGHRVSRVVARDAFVVGFAKQHEVPREDKGKTILGVDVKPPTMRNQPELGEALIIAVKPEDVMAIAQVDGSDAHVSLVLHSREAVKRGQMPLVGAQTPVRTVELLEGINRQRVTVP